MRFVPDRNPASRQQSSIPPHYTTPIPGRRRRDQPAAAASPVVAQKMLGHSRLETTERYLDYLELEDLWEGAFSPAGEL